MRRTVRTTELMQAARFSRFRGPEVLEIADLPDPHPGPGQVRSGSVRSLDQRVDLRRSRRNAGRTDGAEDAEAHAHCSS